MSDTKSINALHVMESLGIGGGQIMMFELSNGLNKYFGDKCKNRVAGIKKHSDAIVVQPKLLETYGIPLLRLSHKEIHDYCKREQIDIVVHHRVSISVPIKKFLPKHVKYIVISHTAASLSGIRNFYDCADYVVSVCKCLFRCSPIIPTKKTIDKMPVILNGIENDFIKSIEPRKLRGKFKTGRCHRLVPTKFSLGSLNDLEKASIELGGHVHYLMGSGNKALPAAAKGKDCIEYVGEVTDRSVKYSYIKSFDAYYYEIFSNEGASIAVLEALASGVPVICLKRGGIRELVRHGVNGFIEKDNRGMIKRLKELRKNPELLQKMKENTIKDFDQRLHVRHCAGKYYSLFLKALGYA